MLLIIITTRDEFDSSVVMLSFTLVRFHKIKEHTDKNRLLSFSFINRVYYEIESTEFK